MRLIRADGTTVEPGEVITAYNNVQWTILKINRKKILCRQVGATELVFSLSPAIFKLRIEED